MAVDQSNFHAQNLVLLGKMKDELAENSDSFDNQAIHDYRVVQYNTDKGCDSCYTMVDLVDPYMDFAGTRDFDDFELEMF